MAVYALLQFFMAPIFGNLSDRIGRRPVLLGSLAAFGVDFLLTGLATTMTWLFVGRAVAGVFGASFAAAGAYIGDISNDENRARNFGFIGAAWGSGFTLGPVIGGFVAEHIDPRAPFFVAAALALANVVFGFFVLPESLPPERRRKFEWARANPFGAVQEPGPSTHGRRTAVRGVPLPGGARLAARGVDVLHAAQVRLGRVRDRLSLTFVGIMTVIVMGGLTGVVVPQARRTPRHHLRLPAHDARLPGLRLRDPGMDDLRGDRPSVHWAASPIPPCRA